jgi:peptidoglycan hydrolase-like amidase
VLTKRIKAGVSATFTNNNQTGSGDGQGGSQPYLVAGDDPYDGWAGNRNHAWSTTVATGVIEKAYPAIGTLQRLTVTQRTGGGDWGGRVSSIDLVGSQKTVTITGNDARWAFGLKSNWFSF